MSQRRMFSPEIVCSEEFLDMPASSRDLYYQLSMRADDDGFVQPKMIMKLLGSSVDDLKVLTAKRFILPFESGVVVIKHWLIHNMIRLDRYKGTRFLEEKSKLFVKENKAYTDNSDNGVPLLATKWQPNGNQSAPQVSRGKVRLDTTNETNSDFNSTTKKYTDIQWQKVLNDWRRSGGRVMDNKKLIKKKNGTYWLISQNGNWEPRELKLTK